MLDELKEKVFEANIELVKRGLVIFTWGNASEIDENREYVVIKPSGVDYGIMKADDMVVIRLSDGLVIGSSLRPSSDTDTHLELYRSFPDIKGITHTHSVNAVAFAQAGRCIPALGTTHADYFYGDIPCTRALKKNEVESSYEMNTGKVIAETIKSEDYDPMAIPGILVRNHGPFSWGKSAYEAVHNAVVMETVAEMCLKTIMLNPKSSLSQYVLDKHYYRKHGITAYYGQI